MTSALPNVQKLAGGLFKQQGDTYNHVLTAAGPRSSVDSVVASAARQDPSMLRQNILPPPRPVSLPNPNGGAPMEGVETVKPTGEMDFQFAPKPMRITNTMNAGDKKPFNDALEARLKSFVEGGDAYGKAAGASDTLAATQEALHTLAQNPEMGAGAQGFQLVRKWGEKLGIATPATTPTEMMGMQLGKLVLAKLQNKLGGNVSNSDVEFLQYVQGAIWSDPAALRRLLLIDAKYNTIALLKHETQVNKMQQGIPSGVPLDIPRFPVSFTPPNTSMADEFERLMGDKAEPALPPGVRRVR